MVLALLLPSTGHASWPEQVLLDAECFEVAFVPIGQARPDIYFTDSSGLRTLVSLPDGGYEHSDAWYSDADDYGPAIGAADFENDGDVDLYMAGFDALLVWQNVGVLDYLQSRFTAATGVGVLSVLRVVDVNADGRSDVAYVDELGDLYVVLDLAYRSWSTPTLVTGTTAPVTALEIGDVDNDGDDDTLVAIPSLGEIEWRLRPIGTGLTVPTVSVATGILGLSAIATADFANSGLADVVWASDSGLQMATNLGGGVFGPPTMLDAGLTDVLVLRAGDVDEDGDQDLVVGSGNFGGVDWLENIGAGTFGPRTPIIAAPTEEVPCLGLYDVDSHGGLDLVVGTGPLDLTLFQYTNIASPDADLDGLTDLREVALGTDPLGADTDQDGLSDLVEYDSDGVTDPLNPDTDNDTVLDGADLCVGFDDLLDADLDAVPDDCDVCEGFNDLADADADGIPDGCDVCPATPTLEDWDEDCVADVVDNCVYEANADQLDTDGDTFGNACDLCEGFDDLTDGDDDGDGRLNSCDLCPLADVHPFTDDDGDCIEQAVDNCLNVANPLQVDSDGDQLGDACDYFPNDATDVNGDGTIDNPRWAIHSYDVPDPVACTSLSLADIDNDGLMDMVVSGDVIVYAPGEIGWFANQGGGNYDAYQFLASATTSRVMAGDLNGDGYADLVRMSEPDSFSNRDLEVNYSQAGIFSGAWDAVPSIRPFNPYWGELQLYPGVFSDLDADGDMDLVYSAWQSNVYLGYDGTSRTDTCFTYWVENVGGVLDNTTTIAQWSASGADFESMHPVYLPYYGPGHVFANQGCAVEQIHDWAGAGLLTLSPGFGGEVHALEADIVSLGATTPDGTLYPTEPSHSDIVFGPVQFGNIDGAGTADVVYIDQAYGGWGDYPGCCGGYGVKRYLRWDSNPSRLASVPRTRNVAIAGAFMGPDVPRYSEWSSRRAEVNTVRAVGDLTGNGFDDVLVGSKVFYNVGGDFTGYADFVQFPGSPLFSDTPQLDTMADMDGDGDLDILSCSRDGSKVTWFENTLTGVPSPPADEISPPLDTGLPTDTGMGSMTGGTTTTSATSTTTGTSSTTSTSNTTSTSTTTSISTGTSTSTTSTSSSTTTTSLTGSTTTGTGTTTSTSTETDTTTTTPTQPPTNTGSSTALDDGREIPTERKGCSHTVPNPWFPMMVAVLLLGRRRQD